MSTKYSIAYADLEAKDGKHAYCHIYTDCFDAKNEVLIEAWEQTDDGIYNETIGIRADVWKKIVDDLTNK